MRLSELLVHIDVLAIRGPVDREVTRVTRDTRQATDDSVFVAVRGERFDGHDAVARVPSAVVVVERALEAAPGATVVLVPDSRAALAKIAAALHGFPAQGLKLVGVTGTNGKTTTATLICEALRAVGRKAGRIGTTGAFADGRPLASELTTPEADALQGLLAAMRASGCEAVSMEASSIGLVQRRLEGVRFDVAIFTQLGRDHLDFHGTEEAYVAAKAQLFTEHLRPRQGEPRALVNVDDPAWPRLQAPPERWGFGFAEGADIRILAMDGDARGVHLRIATPMGEGSIHTSLVGPYNARNHAAALGALLLLGLPLDLACQGLSAVVGVDGRLEPVANDRGLAVLVDYAHTPDALAAALAAVRPLTRGRLWVIFGCGGDRDAAKRPEMGRAAQAGADRVVVTTDNPRSEDPQSIIDAILSGMDLPPARVELDRAAAIRWTLAEAQPGDTVLIAGKGHETYQEIQGQKYPFDDRLVARDALEAR